MLAAAVVLAACGDTSPTSAPREIVVPAGTMERLGRGEVVDVMPSRLELEVGEVLTVRNEDAFTQAVGPWVVAPGEELEVSYGAPGRYEGECPLSGDGSYEVVVVP